jgi:hypothetical protein
MPPDLGAKVLFMMTLTSERELVSVEDFLKKEGRSEVKHEYLAGMVYVMAGASEAHNVIAMNLYTALGNRLCGKICQPFGSDMKLKLHPLRDDTYSTTPTSTIPTRCLPVMRPTRATDGASVPPCLSRLCPRRLAESTSGRNAWPTSSLRASTPYVRIEQDGAEVAVDRRVSGVWEVERLAGLNAVIELPKIGVELPVAELYDRVKL